MTKAATCRTTRRGSRSHLDVGGKPITDGAHNEQQDYPGGHGVDAAKSSTAKSLFLENVS
ncbi:hypothetical protein [Amycolatopsis sp. NPDC051061]|uniref:hypothetical protein n=1 Tax=Amycolatopsis sp. NPDC051061 TaxID=3155042 RepID=UPI0034404BD3